MREFFLSVFACPAEAGVSFSGFGGRFYNILILLSITKGGIEDTLLGV